MATKSKTASATRLENAAAMAGALVWWDFEDVKVRPADAARVVAQHGMDQDVTVPAALDEVTALRRATRTFNGGRGDHVRAEVVGVHQDGTVEVAVLRHQKLNRDIQKAAVGTEKARWEQVDTVVYDRNTHGWLYQGATPPAAGYVAEADEKREYLDHSWVRKEVIQATLAKLGAFPLRRRLGGFFFVPAGSVPKAEALAALVHDLPADCELHVAHISSTAASQQAIGQAAREFLVDGIGELKQRLAAWKESNRQPRADAVEGALAEFASIKSHMALYRDALRLELGDVEAQVQEAMAIALEVAEAVQQQVAPGDVTVVRSLVGSHGHGAVVPWAALVAAGLPERAGTAGWWRERGQATAKAAGCTAQAQADGVAFGPAEPEPQAAAVA